MPSGCSRTSPCSTSEGSPDDPYIPETYRVPPGRALDYATCPTAQIANKKHPQYGNGFATPPMSPGEPVCPPSTPERRLRASGEDSEPLQSLLASTSPLVGQKTRKSPPRLTTGTRHMQKPWLSKDSDADLKDRLQNTPTSPDSNEGTSLSTFLRSEASVKRTGLRSRGTTPRSSSSFTQNTGVNGLSLGIANGLSISESPTTCGMQISIDSPFESSATNHDLRPRPSSPTLRHLDPPIELSPMSSNQWPVPPPSHESRASLARRSCRPSNVPDVQSSSPKIPTRRSEASRGECKSDVLQSPSTTLASPDSFMARDDAEFQHIELKSSWDSDTDSEARSETISLCDASPGSKTSRRSRYSRSRTKNALSFMKSSLQSSSKSQEESDISSPVLAGAKEQGALSRWRRALLCSSRNEKCSSAFNRNSACKVRLD